MNACSAQILNCLHRRNKLTDQKSLGLAGETHHLHENTSRLSTGLSF